MRTSLATCLPDEMAVPRLSDAGRSRGSFRYRMVVYVSQVILAFALGSCATNDRQQGDAASPNILFIIVDDLGWSDLACYGADLHETPNIDRLAAKSFKFMNGYSSAAICSPTRAALLTGKYPARLNFTTWSEDAARPTRGTDKAFLPPSTVESLPLQEFTLAELLKSKGYRTAHVGKWHVGNHAHFPETQGFDINVAASYWGAPPGFFYPYRGNYMQSDQYRYVAGLERDINGHYFTDRKDEYLTDRLTSEALKIIENAGSQPFYLNLAYYSVHVPIEAKPATVQYFADRITDDMHHRNATYAAMVKHVDENVGRLLDKLEALGIDDNTIVIFTSDNGGFVNPYKDQVVTTNFPLRSGKGTLYEGGIKVPTLIYWPAMASEAKEILAPMQTIDFFPTIADIIDADFSHTVDGTSLVPLLRGDEADLLQRALYWHFPHYHRNTNPVSAVREGQWKLVEYLDTDSVELYDLHADGGETTNRIHGAPEKARELLTKLHAWREQVHAQPIRPNPDYKDN